MKKHEMLPGDAFRIIEGPTWEAWKALGDAAADFAMKVQATPKAPPRFVKLALALIEMHRDLRPQMYGLRIETQHTSPDEREPQ